MTVSLEQLMALVFGSEAERDKAAEKLAPMIDVDESAINLPFEPKSEGLGPMLPLPGSPPDALAPSIGPILPQAEDFAGMQPMAQNPQTEDNAMAEVMKAFQFAKDAMPPEQPLPQARAVSPGNVGQFSGLGNISTNPAQGLAPGPNPLMEKLKQAMLLKLSGRV